MKLNDPDLVRRQYETEAGLAVRRDAVARFREGPDAVDAALLAAIAAPTPRRVLEVGCGMGQFAELLLAELDLDLIAVDLSPRMVELARERSVDARVGDAQRLPFQDNRFDCVVANWMLYHVDDLELALSEFNRVLVPGGRLVAATIGEAHMREVWELMGFFASTAAVFAGERRRNPEAAFRGGRTARRGCSVGLPRRRVRPRLRRVDLLQ
jgi:ubiquinone/menaquinone biosynthesis C-methylase UbiE